MQQGQKKEKKKKNLLYSCQYLFNTYTTIALELELKEKNWVKFSETHSYYREEVAPCSSKWTVEILS